MFTWNELATIASILGMSLFGFAYLSRQFSIINSSIYKVADGLRSTFLDKLEYHERHDDVRFDNVRKDIYQLGLKMAAKTGEINGNAIRD